MSVIWVCLSVCVCWLFDVEVNSMIEDLELPWIVYCTQERRLPDLK